MAERLPLNQKFQNFRNEANLSSTNPKPLLAAYDLIAVLGCFIIVLTTYNLMWFLLQAGAR